jgi:hypothetical protein
MVGAAGSNQTAKVSESALVFDATSGSLSVGGTGALRVPNGTEAQRPTPAAGQIRFNTDTNEFEGYDGTAWAAIGGAGGGEDELARTLAALAL